MCLVFGRHGAAHAMHDIMGRSPAGPGVWVSPLPHCPPHPPKTQGMAACEAQPQATADDNNDTWHETHIGSAEPGYAQRMAGGAKGAGGFEAARPETRHSRRLFSWCPL